MAPGQGAPVPAAAKQANTCGCSDGGLAAPDVVGPLLRFAGYDPDTDTWNGSVLLVAKAAAVMAPELAWEFGSGGSGAGTVRGCGLLRVDAQATPLVCGAAGSGWGGSQRLPASRFVAARQHLLSHPKPTPAPKTRSHHTPHTRATRSPPSASTLTASGTSGVLI